MKLLCLGFLFIFIKGKDKLSWIRTMTIHEYISNGAVLHRLQDQLTKKGLEEFNTLADQHPELQAELVYAYDLLISISSGYPPEEVVRRFREAYNGHLQQYITNVSAGSSLGEAKDVSGRYRVHPKSHRTIFYCYIVFLVVLVSLTVYYYLHTRT